MFKFKNNIISKLYLLVVIFSLFSCKEDDLRKVYLRADQKKVTNNPNEEFDIISYLVKGSVSRSINGIDTDKLKYYSIERNDTLLVIVKVGDMLGIERSSRKKLLYAIQDYLNSSEYYCKKKIYIDVEGNFSTLLVRTPLKIDLDGRFANEELILSFYGKSIIPVNEK
ncbi:hypothetical protein IRZ71_22245 [Flavobacterium sp. ANB]|uniref:hypothetical protein n=1 Tax=unclassified Flavobacterium TaxID=196869 RepID=UPI00188BBE0B|nr:MULTISPECIES: hypothetical protein [unclassified Flavobacterium]MBF4519083.1 hypothetical protein [Flavobacterium sp. ANB]